MKRPSKEGYDMAGIEESQRFPFVNLEKAVERAKQIFDGDHRGGEMSVPTAFSLWSYSEKSSGGNQTVSALKSYGLLADSGVSETRRVRLTPNALKYFKDEREEVRLELLAGFATCPPLLKALWVQWGAHPPSDTVARSHLKVDRGLAEQSARSLLGIYKDNLAFAKLTGERKIPEVSDAVQRDDGGPKAKVGDYIRWSSAPFEQGDPPRRVVWVSDDEKFVRVHGNLTGIPMSEVSIAEAPSLRAIHARYEEQPPGDSPEPNNKNGHAQQDITVLLAGGRLQITADVDAAGIAKLKEILAKYEEILKLLQ